MNGIFGAFTQPTGKTVGEHLNPEQKKETNTALKAD